MKLLFFSNSNCLKCFRSRSILVSLFRFRIVAPGIANRHHTRSMSSSDAIEKRLVAICQVTSTDDKNANLKMCRSLVEQAASQGAKMVFLPEAFDYIAANKDESFALSEDLNEGPTIKQYRELAKTLKVWLSLGGFHQTSPTQVGRLRNSHVIIAEDGSIASVYDKLHLFDVDIQRDGKQTRLRESDFTERGNTLVPPVVTPVGKIGLATCYDLRFPEMSMALAQAGAEILTFPSAFTVVTGQAHWDILLRNKAIEYQCYVIAAAQTGRHNDKRNSYGHSMIVDPWGRIIASCQEEVGVAVAEINLDYLRQVREEMPTRNHRRTDIYGTISVASQLSFSVDKGPFTFGHVTIPENQIFLRLPKVVAFVNIKPVVPGHVLVAPTRSVERLSQLSSEEVAELFCAVQKVQRVVEQEFGVSSSTISVQDGPEAGQTVKHVHVHVLPRKRGDFKQNDEIYSKLEEHDKDGNHINQRSSDDMVAEATRLCKGLSIPKVKLSFL